MLSKEQISRPCSPEHVAVAMELARDAPEMYGDLRDTVRVAMSCGKSWHTVILRLVERDVQMSDEWWLVCSCWCQNAADEFCAEQN